ncbi:MAG: sigma-54 dependent transcriptional regulator [Planctomycetota bacterium]|nr:sigma-54 dependent transcriptional regulator [Planctomycetota bacterium]
MTQESVLVVDDERDMAESCGYFLRRAGFKVKLADSADEALEHLDRHRFDLVITDLKMPRMSGLSLLDAVKSRDPDIEVLLITGYPGIKTAVDAIKRGAFDYVPKPFDEAVLMERVGKALAHRRVKAGNEALQERLREGAARKMTYQSTQFADVVDEVRRAARTDTTVLVLGESGTGKELLAHYLHDESDRAGRPFIPVDCTTIPENLVESELFGHVKGAFTGATRDKIGLFQVADGGTLFLDEVGELPLAFQAKLLRALQERQVRPVGGSKVQDVDVRLVCATNRDLEAAVSTGRFREDLFYRLDVVRVVVPPLRDRVGDVGILSEIFRANFVAKNPTCRIEGIAGDAQEALAAFRWPGNVRQLSNAIERACALGKGRLIEMEDLTDDIAGRGSAVRVTSRTDVSEETFKEMKTRRVAAMESSYLVELLEKNKGNVTHSADAAGMTRSAFQKLMQRYGIKSRDYR